MLFRTRIIILFICIIFMQLIILGVEYHFYVVLFIILLILHSYKFYGFEPIINNRPILLHFMAWMKNQSFN